MLYVSSRRSILANSATQTGNTVDGESPNRRDSAVEAPGTRLVRRWNEEGVDGRTA